MSTACAMLLAALLPLGAQPASGSIVWGGFDASRINYASGPLTGAAHLTLRGIIQAHGGSVAPGTPMLTAEYLDDVDVFYTSLLSKSTGVLSEAEQAALQDWIADGGTLIVSADVWPLAAYESFTSAYGVTGYRSVSSSGTGHPVASHMITAGISSYCPVTHCTFACGPHVLVLGDDGNGHDFMAVLEPDTGFDAGGRLLVFGDHNMFTDEYIGLSQNLALASNIAAWAAVPEPAALALLALGALALVRRRRSM